MIFTKMSRNGKSFLKPGGLVQKMTKYEKDRKKTIQKNKIRFDALGIKSLKNSMFGSIEKDNSESCRVGKRKVGETDNDEDYQPLDDDEGLSSSSDNGEPFDSQVIEDIHMGPGRKTNRCAARLIASQTPREKRSTVDEDTLTLPRRPVAAQVNHSESTPEVSTQPIHLPALHTRPDQLPTSATQPNHLSSPCTMTNSGVASIPVLGKKRVRGPTRGKNVEKIRKERGDRIPVTLNRLTKAIEEDYATPLAAALGQQIRVHAPVRNDGWLEIAFGLRESIVTRVGQTFDFGDYNNDILYPCTKDDWEWMIDNLWETDDWKVKSENAMKARGCVKYNHTSGSRSFASRASIIVQGSKPTITKLFEDTHKRHRHGGVWINNTAEEHHATMVSKIAEQSQPSVTHPLSEEQISREVLGKRSVFLKGYGIRKDSTSSSTHFEAPNSEVIVLQQQLVDQRQQLANQGKQLVDQAQNMSTMQTIIQMLAAKNGIDLANIPGLVPSNNVGEDASGVREDETSLAKEIVKVENKEHGKASAAASLYFHSNDNHVIAGALLGVGIVNCGIKNDCDRALALLADYIDTEDSSVRIGAIMGLGRAYAGAQNEQIRSKLTPILGDNKVPLDVIAFTAISLALVYVGSCNEEVAQAIIFALMDRSESELGEPLTRLLSLGLGLLYLGKQATAEVSKTFNEKIRKYYDMTLLSCAYAGTGNVLKVQHLLGQCAQHLEKGETHQGPAILGIAMVAMAEELGLEMAIRSLEHLLQYGEQNIRRAVPLALGLLCISNPKVNVMDTLNRLSHDTDTEVAMAGVISLGLIGAGTNNARIAGMLRNLSSYYYKESSLLFCVRIAQGLVHLGKGLLTLAPYHSERFLLSPGR
ncbi:unnamed protein product [Camellia sinensis]